jgi:hypothetical protein
MLRFLLGVLIALAIIILLPSATLIVAFIAYIVNMVAR